MNVEIMQMDGVEDSSWKVKDICYNGNCVSGRRYRVVALSNLVEPAS
jgi:hypothetical protein